MRERLGGRYLRSITKADVEALVSWMLTSGRRRGGKAGTGLSARSVRLTLGRLTAALEMAVAERKIGMEPGAVRRAALAHPAGAGDVDQDGGPGVPGRGRR